MITYQLSLLICVISGIIFLFLPDKHWTVIRLRELCKVGFAIGLFCFLFLQK